MSPRPGIGQPTVLVYRECMCGSWCATGEGSTAPLCGGCGRRMMPLGTADMEDGKPLYGKDPQENRRLRGLGFLGVLTNEITACEQVGRLNKTTGIFDALLAHSANFGCASEPYASKREIELALAARGFPTNRVWTSPPWEPPVGADREDGPQPGEWLISPGPKAPVA